MNQKRDKLFPLSENAFYVLLCLYFHSPIHGYTIKKNIYEYSGHRLNLPTSSIYLILNRFVRTGIAKITHVDVPSPSKKHQRVYYSITPDGINLFQAELERLKHLLQLPEEIRRKEG